MKKSVYLSGLFSAITIMLGSLFKILHWPGANVSIILAVIVFCFYFFPVGLSSLYKISGQGNKKGLYLTTFIVFFIGIISFLFKIMHWPGAGVIIILGILLPFIVFLPVYLFYTRNDSENETKNFLSILFGLTFLAVFLALLSIKPSEKTIKTLEQNLRMNESRLTLYQLQLNDSLKFSQADEVCSYIEDIKTLIAHKNNVFLSKQVNASLNNSLLASLNKEDISQGLKQKLMTFIEELKTKQANNNSLLILAEKLFNTPLSEDTKEVFHSADPLIALNELTEMEGNVRMLQVEAQNHCCN